MKIKHQLSIATLLMAGVFVTGCSQQQVAGGSQSAGSQQVSGSQQQVEEAQPIVAEAQPIAPPPAAPPMMKKEPPANPWNHFHPEAPACALTKSHSHKYAKTGQAHRHNYGCLRKPAMTKAPEPQVDVRALQLKLQAKGYYRGPIDGVVGPSTRDALQRFMKR